MFKSQWYPGNSISSFTAGQVAKSLMLNNRLTYAIGLLFQGTLTIAGATASAAVNDGSILGAFDEVGFMDNGVKKLQFDARAAGFLTGALMPSARSRTTVTVLTAGATSLKEMVILFFGQPYQLNPWETAYQEQDTKAELAAYVIPNGSITSGAAIATAGGGGTVALTAVTVEATQYYSLDTSTPAMLRPYTETRAYSITGSGANQELSHRTDRYLGGLLYLADSVQATVRVQDTTILSAIALRSDPRYIVGENAITVNSLNLFNDQWQGESFNGKPVSFLRFVEFGRLSTVVDPRVDYNLRTLATAAPSSVGSATLSRVLVALMGYERIAGVTAQVVPFLDGAGAVATS